MNKRQAAPPVVLKDVRVFNSKNKTLSEPRSVYIWDGKIVQDGEQPRLDPLVIEGGGRVLVPGLSDAHAHVFAAGSTLADLTMGSTGRGYYNAAAEAERMLMRGFTTIRDMGGDTAPLKEAIDAGILPGPRIYPCQAAISQTSGHGDFSLVNDAATLLGGPPSRAEAIGFMRVADGRDQVLAAVREQLKKGASQIKLMAGGGVSSAYDPLDVVQFTPDELRAAVEAAADWGTYVSTHVYNVEGIRRAVEAGVKSIEHGHLADKETIKWLADKDVWLSTQPFIESDHHYDSPASAEKNQLVCEGVKQTLAWAREYDVKVAFGTDLLLDPAGADKQAKMFARMATEGFDFTPAEALAMATYGNAQLFRLAGERDPYKEADLGVIEPGAWADVLLVEGDPTENLSLFEDPDKNLAVIIKDGRIYKNQLDVDPWVRK
ncbi:amidohydrolase family protein [Streptomyces prasinus]|uniref:metal-dependent hydrolase family protein n=1 Tax=Streptomyces prasinus TaxID=67345 RepID=UPI0037D41695